MSLVTRLTYLLPHRLMSSVARRLAYSSSPRTKQWLIDTVTRKFGVNLSEAAQPDPAAYPTFNAFFTRALKAGARVPDPDPRALLMPADGRISQCGPIRDGRIFQAFVKSVGIYPVGTLVKLESGKLGVVTEQSEKSLLKPKVKVFYSIKSGMRIESQVFDMSHASVRDKIIGQEDPGEWNFPDLNELWSGMAVPA